MSSNVIVIAGPTASGKSWLGAALAGAIGGVVINADSQQLYNALPILTAQPTEELTQLAPHRLYGAIDPDKSSTAAWWAEAAHAEIVKAQAAGQAPILVGGTGLYLEALMRGIAPIPEIPEATRMQARADMQALGREAFYTRLIAADPASAVLKQGDTQRILRAWEVFAATGRPLTAWQKDAGDAQSDFIFHSIIILPPREILRAACDYRFTEMIERGAIEEVETFAQHFGTDVPATRALGFSALLNYLQKNLSLDEAIAIAQAQTRQYAKRQGTWFRNRFQRTTLSPHVFDSTGNETLKTIIEAFTRI